MKTQNTLRRTSIILAGFFILALNSCNDNDDIINDNLPVLTTKEVTEVTRCAAVSGGNISFDGGGYTITSRGVVWGREDNPTLENNEGYTNDGEGAGPFISNLIDLNPETRYYVRAYATNINGTGYGNNLSFETIEEPDIIYGNGVTDTDGNEYITVIIGDQEWMAENLRVTRYSNEDEIPTYPSDYDWQVTTEGAYTIYNNDEEMVTAYGKLYNWYAVSDSRGICPEGWSVPSDDDWTELVDYVASQGFPNSKVPNVAGNALKSCRQVGSPLGGDCDTSTHPRWNSHDTHYGFDEFGFSALSGGYRSPEGNFHTIGNLGFWWSSCEFSSTDAWYRRMYNDSGGVTVTAIDKRDGFSVRCFREVDN